MVTLTLLRSSFHANIIIHFYNKRCRVLLLPKHLTRWKIEGDDSFQIVVKKDVSLDQTLCLLTSFEIIEFYMHLLNDMPSSLIL